MRFIMARRFGLCDDKIKSIMTMRGLIYKSEWVHWRRMAVCFNEKKTSHLQSSTMWSSIMWSSRCGEGKIKRITGWHNLQCRDDHTTGMKIRWTFVWCNFNCDWRCKACWDQITLDVALSDVWIPIVARDDTRQHASVRRQQRLSLPKNSSYTRHETRGALNVDPLKPLVDCNHLGSDKWPTFKRRTYHRGQTKPCGPRTQTHVWYNGKMHLEVRCFSWIDPSSPNGFMMRAFIAKNGASNGASNRNLRQVFLRSSTNFISMVLRSWIEPFVHWDETLEWAYVVARHHRRVFEHPQRIDLIFWSPSLSLKESMQTK